MIIAILLSSDCWPFFCNHNKKKLHGVLINYNNPGKWAKCCHARWLLSKMTTIPPWVTQNSSPQLILQLHQYDHVFENILPLQYQVGNLGQVNYAASKAGVEGLTRSCAKELAKYVSHSSYWFWVGSRKVAERRVFECFAFYTVPACSTLRIIIYWMTRVTFILARMVFKVAVWVPRFIGSSKYFLLWSVGVFP